MPGIRSRPAASNFGSEPPEIATVNGIPRAAAAADASATAIPSASESAALSANDLTVGARRNEAHRLRQYMYMQQRAHSQLSALLPAAVLVGGHVHALRSIVPAEAATENHRCCDASNLLS